MLSPKPERCVTSTNNSSRTVRIRAFDNPRNLFHRHVSAAWREEIVNGRHFLFDGEEKILEWEYFEGPRPELKELATANGDVFTRADKREQWRCVAGPRAGEQFDEIEHHWEVVRDYDVEDNPRLAPLVGCGDVNLVGLDAVICEFPA